MAELARDPCRSGGASGTSLVATLKPASTPGSRWVYLASLFGLLAGRAIFYWLIAPRVHWIPRLSLGLTTLAFGPISEAFRVDVMLRFLLFSFLSFGLAMAWFYMCLLFLSAVNAKFPENNPHQRFIQLHLAGSNGRRDGSSLCCRWRARWFSGAGSIQCWRI